jgi:hypothetical protein
VGETRKIDLSDENFQFDMLPTPMANTEDQLVGDQPAAVPQLRKSRSRKLRRMFFFGLV